MAKKKNGGDMNNLSSTVTIFGKGTQVKGKVSSQGDIRIDGTIDGTISCEGKVILGDTSEVALDITTIEMNINGRFKGNLVADKQLIIGDKGVVSGDVKTPSIIVEEGAVINASITMKGEGIG